MLKPSETDPFTSYRFYSLDRLARIHRIMALKELGLSLAEIAQLLLEDLPPEQIRGRLRYKQIAAETRIREEQIRLAQIKFRLSGFWRFVWHRGPMHHADPSEYVTELQYPLEPA
jgi:DNA-binding transcriptional MerR regulator